MHLDDTAKARARSIAQRLIALETSNPGTVRFAHNPNTKSILVRLLTQLNYKKPFLTSHHDYVFNSVFSNGDLFGRILPCCILSGAINGRGANELWDGTGRYRGYQGALALLDFSRGEKGDVFLIIDIQPFFGRISDLLDPVRDLTNEH